MGTVLLATWDGGGNVPPMLALAQELQRRGHTVGVVGHASQRAAVVATGLPFNEYPVQAAFGFSKEPSFRTVTELFGDRALGTHVAAVAEDMHADLVVVDCVLGGVMDALAERVIPYVVLEHLFDAYLRGRHVNGPVGLAMRLKGLRPRRLLDGASRCIVASLPELDPAGSTRGAPPNRTHTGPFVVASLSTPRTPTVLVSLSTVAHHSMQGVWQRTLDALAELPVRVVATTGPAIAPSALSAGANTQLLSWAPHGDLMPEASVMIGHGGHSTTMLALAHGLPLLVMPIFAPVDQGMVGASVQAYGAGRMLRKSASSRRIRETVETLLEDQTYRVAAWTLGTRIRELDGLSRATDLVEGLLGPRPRGKRPARG
ncbi:MAG TPA: glycosyltransferase [Propionibacteriaceae bacterium]|nr:glycosyltransferase [Propionibacteriaceae bacterium]